MLVLNANLFFGSSSQDYYYYVEGISNLYQNSFIIDEDDAPILDSFINVYENIGSNSFGDLIYSSNPKISIFDTIQVLSPTGFSQLSYHFVNFFSSATETLDGGTVPMFFKISGLITDVNTSFSQKLIVFTNNLQPLYLQKNPSSTRWSQSENVIGCSSSFQGQKINCNYHEGLLSGAPCTPSNCTHDLYKSQLVIHFPNNLMSLSSIIPFHILIPIQFAPAASTLVNFSIGLFSSHSGQFSDFLKMNNFKFETQAIMKPSAQAATLNSIKLSSATINQNSLSIDKFVRINTQALPQIGSSFYGKI